MKVSNLRYEIDQTTFEQYNTVDVSVDFTTLYELRLYNEEIQNELYMMLGKELVARIRELRNDERTN